MAGNLEQAQRKWGTSSCLELFAAGGLSLSFAPAKATKRPRPTGPPRVPSNCHSHGPWGAPLGCHCHLRPAAYHPLLIELNLHRAIQPPTKPIPPRSAQNTSTPPHHHTPPSRAKGPCRCYPFSTLFRQVAIPSSRTIPDHNRRQIRDDTTYTAKTRTRRLHARSLTPNNGSDAFRHQQSQLRPVRAPSACSSPFLPWPQATTTKLFAARTRPR